MKKVIFSLFAVAVLATSCENKDAYTISGKMEAKDSTKVYLKEPSFDRKVQPKILDSTIVKNGMFEFKGVATEPAFNFIIAEGIVGKPKSVSLVVEAGKINVNLDSLVIRGTKSNDDYQAYLNKVKPIDEQVASILDKANTLTDKDGESLEKLKKDFDDLNIQRNKESLSYVKANISNPTAIMTFIYGASQFETDEIKEVLGMLSSKDKELAPIKKIERRVNAIENTAEGKSFVDLKSKDQNGKDIALSDYAGKNKLVLVDFWASWCPPCRKDMPEVVELYKKYQPKGFEVVGVSLDEDAEAWKNALTAMNMTWPQMSDLKGWESDMAAEYAVNSIPHTVLIDKDGKIIAKNLRGEELSKKVAEVLK